MTTEQRVAQARMTDDGRPRTPPSNESSEADKRRVERIMERVKSREEAMQPLWERMDGDYRRWRGEKFVPAPGDGIAPEDAYTSNVARADADKLVSVVGEAERVWRIEADAGEQSDQINGNAERIAIGFYRLANDNLTELASTPLQQTLAFYSVVRGGYTAARALLRKMADGSTRVEIKPIDPRHLIFQMGGNGPIWAAIVTMRTRASVRDEWDFTFDTNVPVDEDANQMEKVVDYYWKDRDGTFMNAVIIPSEGRFAKKPANTFAKRFPIIIRAIGSNPGVANFDITSMGGTRMQPGIEDLGESFFGPNRHVYDMDHRVKSYIISTLADRVQGIYKVFSADGEFSLEEPPRKAGQVTLNTEMAQDLQLLDIPQITSDALTTLSFIDSDKVARGVPPSARGLSQGSQSGRALQIMNAQLGELATPFVRSVESCLLGSVNALMEQYETGFYEPVRVTGKRLDNVGFNMLIPGEAIVGRGPLSLTLTPVLPEDDEMKWQIAAFANQVNPATQEPVASTTFIREKILKMQDPSLERQRIYAQMARLSTPRMLIETQLEAAVRSGDAGAVQFLIEERDRIIQQQMMEDVARQFAFMQAMGQNPVQTAADGMGGGGGRSNGNGSVRSATTGMAPESMPLSGTPFGPSPGANDATANAGVPRPNGQGSDLGAAIGLELG